MKTWTRSDLDRMFQQVTGPEGSDDPRVRKKQRLVKAATELFTQQGYRKTSVDEIAEKAGVAKGTVYLYFKSKAEIMVHAIVAEKSRYLGIIAPCFEEEVNPRDRLRLLVRSGFIMGTTMPMTGRLLAGDREFVALMDDLPEGFMQGRLDLGHDFYLDFLGEATPARKWAPGELERWAKVLMVLVYFSGMLVEDRIRMGMSVDEVAGVLADMVVDGIDGPSGGER